MYNWNGVWLPEGETHLPEWMAANRQTRNGVPCYQQHKYEAALGFVRQRRLALDVGAHIGQWSRNMALDFAAVVAFEPVRTYAECWEKNMAEFTNATLHGLALGKEEGTVSLHAGTPGSLGETYVAPRAEATAARDVRMLTLDSFELREVDLIKVDCEGFEKFVIEGGEETIRRDRPCLIVEQKKGHARKYGLGETDAVKVLRDWGARLRKEIAGDYILAWA